MSQRSTSISLGESARGADIVLRTFFFLFRIINLEPSQPEVEQVSQSKICAQVIV
ncbi:TPA: hypothetical protein GRR44_16685 [Vibrio parahaemolyticus]|nr:hypothetical protein [Vibrio parahaemolyticus]